MICPKLSIKFLIVWNTWLYSLSPVQPLKLSALLAAGWHAEHFQSNQLSWGEGWDDTCNTRDTETLHHDTILASDTKQSRQLQYQSFRASELLQPTSGQENQPALPDQSELARESGELGAEKELNIELNWHIMSACDTLPARAGYVLVFVEILHSSDWNHSVKPQQIGLDVAWGSPSTSSS